MTAGKPFVFTHPNCHVAVCLLAGTLDGEGREMVCAVWKDCEAWTVDRHSAGVAGPYGDLSLLNEAYDKR